jgi:hypothetical protein
LEGECFDCRVRGQFPRLAAPGWLRRARCHSRFRAARPVTFFVLAKKVTKESRACEGTPNRVPCAARGRGRACKLALYGRSDRQALKGSRAPCPARRLRRHSTASRTPMAARRGGSSARGRRSGAGRQRGRAGRVSERAQGASFAPGPLTPCSARAAGARAQAGSVRSPFFGDFLWRSKESYSPPGDSRLGCSIAGRC